MVHVGNSPGALSRAQLRLFSTALVITLLDQVVKRVVVNVLRVGEPVNVIGSFVRFTRTANTGGAFGLFRGHGTRFAVVSLVASAVIVVLSRQIARARRIEQLAFGLILGGAVGNLIDRIRLGAVVDFIDIGGSAYRWPAFNVADSAITIGVTLLAVSLVFMRAPEPNGEPGPGGTAGGEPEAGAGVGQ
jgi:signal peptidase II